MKKNVVIVFICFSAVSLFARTNTTIPANEIIIGRNFKTKVDIKAKECVFPDRIDSWYIDDSTKMMILQFRGMSEDGIDKKDTGSVVQFDLMNRQIVWNKELNYTKSYVDQFDTVLIKTTDNKSSCLNYETGEDLWNSNNTIYYVNPKQMVGAGYRSSTTDGNTNMFEGFDLNTGNLIWKREIKRDYNLNDFIPLNDSVILISADGLHSINLKTGDGWDYDTHTGKKDYTNTILSNLVGLTASALLQTDYEITTGYDVVTDVLSNVLVDSTSIYMADKESLVCLDFYGNIIWKTNLPKKLVSKSSLFFKDNLICMVNDGFASYNGRSISYGKPFIAAFNKEDGKKVFLNALGYKNDQVASFQLQQDTLLLLSKNRVFKYSLKDGTELWENTLKTDSLGELSHFAGTEMFIESDSVFSNPLLTDSSNVYIFNNKNQLLVLNNQLDFKNIIPDNRIANCYLETNGYKFLEEGNNSIVIDKKNIPVAELEVSGYTLLRGTKLYEAQGNSFVEIDIDAVLQK
jgi:hypothetical protein